MEKRYEFQIDEGGHKMRIDEFLFDRFGEMGKKYLRGVIKSEQCQVNGYIANAGIRLKKNDFVELQMDVSAAKKTFSEKIPLKIIFEDSHIIVVNKPAGMLVHPTPQHRNGTLLNGLVYHLNKAKFANIAVTSECLNMSNMKRPGLIHRLDKQTSGLLLVAKKPRALRVLGDHFKRKLVKKKYISMVEGKVKQDIGIIEAPIGRYDELRHWNIKADGKPSETRFRVIERLSDTTRLELEPVTGRTNQLRIHCAYIGNPILGDEWHGKREFPRLCLHASKLGFRHPESGKILHFTSDISF